MQGDDQTECQPASMQEIDQTELLNAPSMKELSMQGDDQTECQPANVPASVQGDDQTECQPANVPASVQGDEHTECQPVADTHTDRQSPTITGAVARYDKVPVNNSCEQTITHPYPGKVPGADQTECQQSGDDKSESQGDDSQECLVGMPRDDLPGDEQTEFQPVTHMPEDALPGDDRTVIQPVPDLPVDDQIEFQPVAATLQTRQSPAKNGVWCEVC